MGKKEADAEKEGLFMGLLKLFDSPAREFPVTFVFITMRKRSPVNKRMMT